MSKLYFNTFYYVFFFSMSIFLYFIFVHFLYFVYSITNYPKKINLFTLIFVNYKYKHFYKHVLYIYIYDKKNI